MDRLHTRLVALVLLSVGLAHARDETLRERIDRLFAPAIEGEWLTGAAVGVIDGEDTLVLGYGRGVGDEPPDGDTVYEIGSVSKTFTGTLLADMVERGVVSLEDPVEGLLPKGVTVPKRKGKEVLLWHLSTHTSGLPRMPDNFTPKDPENPYADYSVAQMYAFVKKTKLARDPGAEYEYSNLGAGLLGHALALKAKMPYERLLEERIRKPLGMTSTRIALTDDMLRRLAPPCLADGTPTKRWDFPTLAGAGGIRSTVNDMLAYLRANLHPGDDDLGRAMKLAQTPRHDFPGGKIGLGWHITPDGGVWHNGQTGGYHSFIGFNPKTGRGVVILSNTGNGIVDGIGGKVLEILAGKKPKPPELPQPARVAPEVLERYVGTYRGSGLEFTVTREEGRLYVQLTGQARFRVFAMGEREFVYRIVEARITFDGEDEVTGLVLHQNGKDMPAARMDD